VVAGRQFYPAFHQRAAVTVGLAVEGFQHAG
jgi:hypothetical protein